MPNKFNLSYIDCNYYYITNIYRILHNIHLHISQHINLKFGLFLICKFYNCPNFHNKYHKGVDIFNIKFIDYYPNIHIIHLGILIYIRYLLDFCRKYFKNKRDRFVNQLYRIYSYFDIKYIFLKLYFNNNHQDMSRHIMN